MQDSESIRKDHYAHNTLTFLVEYLSQPARLLRVASGYFTLQGYNLLRPYLECEEVRILIGYDQDAPIVLHNELVKRLLEDLRFWNNAERRDAVEAIVNSINLGQFRLVKKDDTEELHFKARQKDHAKIYILDERFALPSSANLTHSGLRTNSENANAISEPERVAYYINVFDRNWVAADAHEVTEDLRNALLRWLELVPPYDVYLKTIDLLSPPTKQQAPKPSYKMPNTYQQEVVQRMLRQLQQYHGSILVASTGLGKTIMATHTALELHTQGLIKTILVFAPVATHPDWQRAIDSARLNGKVFTRNLLDAPEAAERSQPKLFEMLQHLEEVDEYTYIIVDEAQFFANRLRKPKVVKKQLVQQVREAFIRLEKAVSRGGYITLMTATPFVKSARDINNQLALLPHSADAAHQNTKGQYKLLMDEGEGERNWRVIEGGGYFEDFTRLPISTIITTAYVTKHYCTVTPEGSYIDFPDGRRYLPRVSQYRINIPAYLEDELSEVMTQKTLQHKEFHFADRDLKSRRSKLTMEQRAIIAYMSSPLALRRLLEQVVDPALYSNIPFIFSPAERERRLTPFIERLQRMTWKDDVKFQALLQYVDEALAENRKILIFVEVLATATYLQEQLLKARSKFKVASSVSHDPLTNTYKTKSKTEVEQLIVDFATAANIDKRPKGYVPKPYNIFITSDAFGVGVNLQDASVVINYDLCWTPDTIIQRAGRVLRFWHEPRIVSVYTFTHTFTQTATSIAATAVLKRTKTLYGRAKEATLFTEQSFLTDQVDAKQDTLRELSKVTIENLGELSPDNVEKVAEVSPILDRLTERRQHLERAEHIPNDIMSALERFGVATPMLYMLLRHETQVFLVLFDIEAEKLIQKREDAILDLIQCAPNDPIAFVDPHDIERASALCVTHWCNQNEVGIDRVERIATLMLVPKNWQGLQKKMEMHSKNE
jgi:superfamily II DNA or RNA helicase